MRSTRIATSLGCATRRSNLSSEDHERITRRCLFGIMAFSVPCFVFMLLCGGFLPLGVMVLSLLRALGFLDLFRATLLLPHLALYTFLLHRVARGAARHAVRTQHGSAILLVVAAALAAIPMLVPVYWFDCMDGRSATTCSGAQMYVGWFRALPLGRLTAWVDGSCGDLGW
jgi:hypothetical protein